MKLTIAVFVSITVKVALAQVAAYGQCGGSGYTGGTTCVSGYCCTYSNEYYSQCIPGSCSGGTGGTTTTTAAPAAETTFCGQYAEITTSNGYYIINNLWGESDATSGSECTFYNGIVGSGVSWGTTWTWEGGEYDVKSYPHAGLTFTPKTIANIGSMQSTFDWSYTGTSGMRADVSYDMFTDSSASAATSSGDYEVMIWLAYYGGVGPITATGSPIATPTIAGYTWNLYYGLNGSMKVYSFLCTTNPLNSFSGDVKQFFTYLINNEGFPSTTQYLTTFQGGTEPFTGGPATLEVSLFSAAVS